MTSRWTASAPISAATRAAPSSSMSPMKTSAPSAASRAGDRLADPARAAGDQRLSSLEPHASGAYVGPRIDSPSMCRRAISRRPPIPILGGTGALGYGLAVRWARAGLDVVIGSREAERAAEAAERVRDAVPGARGRGPRQRGGRRARPDRLPDRPVPRPVGDAQQPARRAHRRARPSSTAPCRWRPRSAARRPARSASGRARPPSRRRRWCPTGVTVVSALHTVGAPTLADLDATLDEDVLVCGDRKRDKAPVARLIERIDGLRAVNAGAARDRADRRAADAAADLDQRPLQDPRRAEADRAARRRSLGVKRRRPRRRHRRGEARRRDAGDRSAPT